MSILPRLVAIYRAAGFEPLTGHNSYHFGGYMDAPFTKFFKDGWIHGCAGLALQEIMVLEPLGGMLDVRNVLVIGNAHGWSTLALALIFPKARILAIDPGAEGNALTNHLAAENALNVLAAEGFSPRDVGRLRAEQLSGKPDLVLIDAVHTNEALLADFSACAAESHDGTLFVFHDVINWKMGEAFKRIRTEHGMDGLLLTRTPSGMGVAWRKQPAPVVEYLSVFSENAEIFRNYRRFVLENLADPVSGLPDIL